MEPLIAITNGLALFITVDTNLITVARVYPNGIEQPYVIHNQQIVTNHTAIWVYRSNRYEHTFLREFATINTNNQVRTPITQ